MFEDPAAEWPLLPLSDFIQRLDTGVSVNSEDRPHGAGEVGVLKTSALSGSAFNANENKAVLPAEQRLVAEPVSGNSILISRMNTPELVGVACYVRHPYPDLFLPDRIWQAKKKHGCDLDMRWLSYQLQTEGYRRFLGAHATGTSGSMKNLPKSSFLGMRLHFPKADEQRLIASILDTLDTQIQKTEALIAKLEKVKEGLLHDLLTRGIDENGRLRPSPEQAPELYKESPLGLIPISWHFAALGSLLDKIEAGKSPSCPDIPAPSGEWGVLKVSAVNPKGFLSTENKVVDRKSLVVEDYEVKQGDLLITRANTPDLVGASCIIEEWTSRLMLSDKTLRLVENPDLVMKQYIYHSLQKSYVRKQISIAATGTSMSMKNISQGAIRTLSIIVPPIAEQSAICKRVAAISKRISHEQSKVSKLYQDKVGLMDDLLTGRVRVTPLLDQAQATTPA